MTDGAVGRHTEVNIADSLVVANGSAQRARQSIPVPGIYHYLPRSWCLSVRGIIFSLHRCVLRRHSRPLTYGAQRVSAERLEGATIMHCAAISGDAHMVYQVSTIWQAIMDDLISVSVAQGHLGKLTDEEWASLSADTGPDVSPINRLRSRLSLRLLNYGSSWCSP